MLLSFSGESSVYLFAIQNIKMCKYQYTHTHTHTAILVGNLLSSCLLSKSIYRYLNIYGSIILPVTLCGCETWSVTLREEHRLRLFEDRVLRGKFGLKGNEVTWEWRRLHMWSFMICACHQILLGSSNQEE